MDLKAGKFFDFNYDTYMDEGWTLVSNDVGNANVGGVTRVLKPDGSLLACVAWKCIPHELCDLAAECYMAAAKDYTSTNRGTTAGVQHRNREPSGKYDKGKIANSSVVGFINSTNNKRPCRLTSFSKQHFDQYQKGMPFIQKIDTCFKQYVPAAHALQSAMAEKSRDFTISGTAFSTVTVNYNFRTALHRDSGDYKQGFGNLVVTHSDDVLRSKGLLLFPQYKVAISLGKGDFMAMDVHEWHCNSALSLVDDGDRDTGDGSYRLSFVCYLREHMDRCDVINGRLRDIVGNLDGKAWDTEKMYKDIVGENAVKQITGTGPSPHLLQWWTLTSVDGSICLQYKHRQYTLHDRKANKKVRNIIPAWEYMKDKAKATTTVE